MYMSDDEILISYRQAKFPRKQIGILAEMNLCDRSRIIQILSDCGVDPKELPPLPNYKRKSAYTPTQGEQSPRKKNTRRWVWVGTEKSEDPVEHT